MAEVKGERVEEVPVKTDGAEGSIDAAAATASPLPSSTVAATLAILLLALLLRTGWTNVLLVLLCSILFLLNPWVRTFLELPAASDPASSGRPVFSVYDPARFIHFTSADPAGEKDAKPSTATAPLSDATKPIDRSEAYAALRRMPAYLRTPIADLEELIIRDCISSWYDFHSFGEQSLPNQARYSIDHAVGSVYAGLENIRSADVVSDVALTASSVLLTTLREKRLHPGRAPIFSSNTARISAIREALERVLARHMVQQDAKCDLLRTLLREILCKQTWNAICSIGEPDFFNRSIVMWNENQQAKERDNAEASTSLPTAAPTQVPASASTWPDRGAVPSPQPSQRSSTMPSPALPTPRIESPAAFRQATQPLPSPTMPSVPLPAKGASAAPSSSTPGHLTPLTMQPRPMTMPMPPRSPVMSSPSVLQPPPLPRRPIPDDSGPVDQPPLREVPQNQGSNVFPQPPTLPPRKDTKNAGEQVDDSAWLLMPMNIPPEASKGLSLPDSLQSSLRASNSGADTPEGYRLSSDSTREMNSSTSSDFKSPASYVSRNRAHLLDSDPGPHYSGRGDDQGHLSSSDSQPYQARSRPASRPASSASGGIPPAPDLAEVLSSTVSPSLSALRDAFESFLERGGATSRSLFFSPPSSTTVAPGEGTALLKLHYGLATIARLVPDNAKEEGEIYREDAFNTALTALQSLSQADDSIAGRPLREALLVSAQRLEIADDGRLREVLKPVEGCLWTRLLGLYDHFWKETCTRPAGSRPSIASPTLSSSGRASFSANRQSGERTRPSLDQLHYQPRKKVSSTAPNHSAPMSRSESGDNSMEHTFQGSDSAPPSKASSVHDRETDWAASEVVQSSSPNPMIPPPVPPRKDPVSRPVPRRASVQPISDDDVVAASLLEPMQPTIEIIATDVSLNADRPDALVDIRTYEVMIAVEGLVAGGGGFVLLRAWKDLQQMQDQLRGSPLLESSWQDIKLPSVKGQTSQTLTKEIESYLVKILSTQALVASEPVQVFIDKTRAGEPPSNRSTLLMDSLRFKNKGLGLGKTFASGVGVVGKNAINTLQMMPGNVAALSRPITRTSSPARESPSKAPTQLAEEVPASNSNEERRRDDLPPPPSSPRPPAVAAPMTPSMSTMQQQQQQQQDARYDLSPQEMDNLLSCAFAIADEAFNLSGGWTLRRGLLRVIEQVVRTQYFSSIMGMFHNLAYSLNQEQIASWTVQLKEKFWPDEVGIAAPAASKQQQLSKQAGNGVHTQGKEGAAELLAEAVGDDSTSEERGQEEKLACHLKAKSIIVGQTPVGSAYFLGPGGKQSCEKALSLLHEEITRPETSLDLVLTVFLKLCDIASSV